MPAGLFISDTESRDSPFIFVNNLSCLLCNLQPSVKELPIFLMFFSLLQSDKLFFSFLIVKLLSVKFKGKCYADLSVMIIIIRLIQSYFWTTIIFFLIIQWNVRNKWNVVIITCQSSVYYTTIFYFLSYRKKLETATLWQFCLHWLKQQIFTIIWVNSNSVITLKKKKLYSFILFL